MNSNQIKIFLKDKGLICHTFYFNDLPNKLKQELNANGSINFNHRYLSLIANAGPKFWYHLKSHHTNEIICGTSNDKDWVDQHSIKIVTELLNKKGVKQTAKLLYPGDAAAPLTLLGELAGWSSASPLGLGINQYYGPWFAYRALVVTDTPLTAETKPKQAVSPCLTCDAPCAEACPGNAVDKNAAFNISACAAYRLHGDEPNCKTQCHARNACPVGKPFQYSQEQRAYHMGRALNAIVAWAANT